MSDNSPSANMGLPIPNIGQSYGPDYANDINNSLTLIDSHDHTTGKGTQLTPASLNINSDVTFNNNAATNLKGTKYYVQTSTPGNKSVWVKGVDLYYTDDNGTDIQLTASGSVAGSVGSIGGLTSPASATFTSGSFVWKSTASLYADHDLQSIYFHNTTNSNRVNLASVAVPSASYNLVLPTLPATQKIMTLDASGNMSAPYAVDNSTIEVSSNTIQVKDAGIITAKLADSSVTNAKIANGQITTAKIADATITEIKIVASSLTNTSISPSANIARTKLAAPIQAGVGTSITGTTNSSSLTLIGSATISGLTAGTYTVYGLPGSGLQKYFISNLSGSPQICEGYIQITYSGSPGFSTIKYLSAYLPASSTQYFDGPESFGFGVGLGTSSTVQIFGRVMVGTSVYVGVTAAAPAIAYGF